MRPTTVPTHARRALELLRARPMNRLELQGALHVSMKMTRKVIQKLRADGVIHTVTRPTKYEVKRGNHA